MNYRRVIHIIVLGLLIFLISGCSSRMDSPVINIEDGSVTYDPNNEAGIKTDVLLYKGIDEETGLPLTTNSFTLGENFNFCSQSQIFKGICRRKAAEQEQSSGSKSYVSPRLD